MVEPTSGEWKVCWRCSYLLAEMALQQCVHRCGGGGDCLVKVTRRRKAGSVLPQGRD